MGGEEGSQLGKDLSPNLRNHGCGDIPQDLGDSGLISEGLKEAQVRVDRRQNSSVNARK